MQGVLALAHAMYAACHGCRLSLPYALAAENHTHMRLLPHIHAIAVAQHAPLLSRPERGIHMP
jgi:hypothetical protein